MNVVFLKKQILCFSSSYLLRFKPQLFCKRQLLFLRIMPLTSECTQGQEASDTEVRNCYFNQNTAGLKNTQRVAKT